jgi:hypothetical protein
LFLTTNSIAQTSTEPSTKEVGLRTNNLRNFHFMYKKQ